MLDTGWHPDVMVSRQETARALLTPGEVMQLPQDEALVRQGSNPSAPRSLNIMRTATSRDGFYHHLS